MTYYACMRKRKKITINEKVRIDRRSIPTLPIFTVVTNAKKIGFPSGVLIDP